LFLCGWMQRALLLILFFTTGATALGYQLVWARMLANSLGHEMPAVLAVVSACMSGMALGAWWPGTRIQRSTYPGRWYAALEIFIGAWAIIVAPKTPWLLLPAMIAIGASFPAMARFIRPFALAERYIAALYACNTLGAVVGIVAVTWYLMPSPGLRSTALILAASNIVAGVIAWTLSSRVSDPEGDTALADRRSLLTVFVSGFLAIGFEILGVRVLAQVMENTVYSFAAALAVYLLGTSLGAVLYHRFGRDEWLNELLGGAPVVCLGSIFVMARAQQIYNGLRSAFGDSALGAMAAEMTLAACVFLLPTILMGTVFSLLMQRRPVQLPKMLAANTFGAALAPFAFGVLLLPKIGAKWALVLVALGYFALVTRWRWLMPIVAVGMIAVLPNLQFVQVPAGGAIVDYREGVMASVAVVRDAAGDRTLKVNNRFQMGGTSAASTEYRQAHLPLLLHPNPRRALFLGTGTGITFGAASLYPELEADGVELVPEVVQVMHHFKPQNFMDQYAGGRTSTSAAARVEPRPPSRLSMHTADARRFVKNTRNSYDVIIADLFHPARDGAGTLYTKEHFAAIRARLNEGGMFCQWLPLHQMDEQMLRVVTRTFLDVFPNARAYLLHWSVDVPVLGLFGMERWPDYTNGWVEARATLLQNHLKTLAIVDSARVFGNYVAGAEALKRFAGDAPINTDDHQIVTYAAPRFSYQRHAAPYGRLLTILGIEHPSTDFIRARNVYLNGLVHEAEGRMVQATENYIESARISDDFTLGYARCVSLATAQAKDRPESARALLQRLAEAQPRQKLAGDLLERLFPSPRN
jgi:spermidine synthase